MSQNVLVAMVAPASRYNSLVRTPYGEFPVAANGACTVNTRAVSSLLAIGFTCATLPNVSDKSTMSTTVSLAAPVGVDRVQGLGVDIKVVAGRVSVPRDAVESLLHEGYTL